MKTKNKLLKAIAIIALLLGSNQLIAQTNTSPTQTVCAGSLAEPYLINPPTAGSTYQWTLTGGGTLNNGATTDNITVDWGVTPGTYTITVTETDLNGCLGAPVIVDVTVIPLPTATVATSQTACFGSLTIPDLFAIGANVTWYDDVALGLANQVGVGNTFATLQTAVGLYTYYVTESLNGCEGPSVPVTLTIYASDDATFTLTDYCEGSSNSATVTGTTGGVFTFTTPPTGGETIGPLTGEITGGFGGTSYSVTYTTSTGICSQTSVQTVMINPLPTTGPIWHN